MGIPCSLETRGGHQLPWRLRGEVTFELVCEGCVGVYEIDEERRGVLVFGGHSGMLCHQVTMGACPGKLKVLLS